MKTKVCYETHTDCNGSSCEHNPLIEAACRIAARGASEYLRVHKLTAEPSALSSCLKSWVKAKWQEAMNDAKEALECNMGQVAEQSFAATMIQAGIEAAKEAGQLPAPTMGSRTAGE